MRALFAWGISSVFFPKTGEMHPTLKRKRSHPHHAAYMGCEFGGDKLEGSAISAAESVVCIVCRNLQGKVVLHQGWKFCKRQNRELVFPGTGIIIECKDAGEGRYISTILAPAALLGHTSDVPVQPNEIEVDVYLSDSKLYKGEVLACDAHYNLATISILSDLPLRTAVLRGLDDITSLDLYEQHQLCMDTSFQLRPHSTLFKIMTQTKIIVLRRLYVPPYELQVDSGVFCADSFSRFDCKELCWVHDVNYEANYGGAVMNCSGEVLGIMFYDSPFLPSNFISRWWNHYKSNREFNRPWLGMYIANLYAAHVVFLEKLKKFADVSTGIVVTKVENDTPAHLSGIMPKDVIVKCDGMLVRSKVEFLEKIWENSDKPVELEILRASDCRRLNLKLAIGKTTSDKFYRWPLPSWEKIKSYFQQPKS